MTNRINQLLTQTSNHILSIYFTAGYPNLNDTMKITERLELSGVNMIEIGMPYSDPVADGPIIQATSEKALQNGMSVSILFEQIKDLRQKVKIPILLMGYVNPFLQYGAENFLKKASEIGIDGLIIPDLPLELYQEEFESMFHKYNIKNIFLITPQSTDERIRKIDSISSSFIYVVASFSITGTKFGIEAQQESYFKRIVDLKLKNPTVVGFGINDKNSFEKTCKYSNGAIIGSSFLKHIEKNDITLDAIKSFVKGIKE